MGRIERPKAEKRKGGIELKRDKEAVQDEIKEKRKCREREGSKHAEGCSEVRITISQRPQTLNN